MTNIIQSFSEISTNYDAVFCDLWGCLHNGIEPFDAAVQAMRDFCENGGTVVLLTNSPRPSASVYTQLDEIGVPRDIYQGIVASGDAARAALSSGAFGSKVYHLGPARDEGFFQGVSTEDFYQGTDAERVPLNEAEGIVCTGLFDDETETPDDYRAILLAAKTRGLKLLCANPDILVDRGSRRIYCAGAIAALYTEMGGESHYYGKPHAPIYELAYQRLHAITQKQIDPKNILCIGDGIRTDVLGAIGEDMDCLFVTGGLAASDTGTTTQPDAAKLADFLAEAQLSPSHAIGYLR